MYERDPMATKRRRSCAVATWRDATALRISSSRRVKPRFLGRGLPAGNRGVCEVDCLRLILLLGNLADILRGAANEGHGDTLLCYFTAGVGWLLITTSRSICVVTGQSALW